MKRFLAILLFFFLLIVLLCFDIVAAPGERTRTAGISGLKIPGWPMIIKTV